MCGYVLRNDRHGKYLSSQSLGQHALSGSYFTTDLRKARRFRTRGAAQEFACGDETPIEIETLLAEYHA